ncbi:Alpha-L-arabinofuranosidase 1 [Hordeum vulgare]|nr:Alpha-L-arabinofuranosidase 1 [Hordeum vulgare]
MYLERLRNWDIQLSWGSAALAYLYHQLDQASMRTRESYSLCGFVWSLSVWMWERLLVGRPMLKNPDKPNPNPHEALHDEDPYPCPTVAYHWDKVSVYKGSSRVRYKCYMNELDTLTAEKNYLVWYAERYRLKLKPGWTREDWSELVSEDPLAAEGYHAFNMVVRETGGSQVDYAPMHDELGREFLMCVNDANVAFIHPRGGASSERTLKTTLEKFKARFHQWATMFSCHGA